MSYFKHFQADFSGASGIVEFVEGLRRDMKKFEAVLREKAVQAHYCSSG